jgi:hypothetical protein
MSSQAQIAANRANGQKSRGPRTAAGKARTHQNALRHGLSVLNRHNSAYFPEIERIAWAYCEGDADPLLFEQALIIAENDMILMCVNAECLAAIERMRDPHATPFSDTKASFARARARFAQAQVAYAKLVEAKAKTSEAGNVITNGEAVDSVPGKNSTRSEDPTGNTAASHWAGAARVPHSPRQCEEFEAMRRAAPDLARLERYRRRAASRRKRAIREFIFIRSLREFRLQAGGMHDDRGDGESCCGPKNRDMRCPAP